MNLVLSLQKLAGGPVEYLDLGSSASDVCSSASDNGCTIVKTGATF